MNELNKEELVISLASDAAFTAIQALDTGFFVLRLSDGTTNLDVALAIVTSQVATDNAALAAFFPSSATTHAGAVFTLPLAAINAQTSLSVSATVTGVQVVITDATLSLAYLTFYSTVADTHTV